MMILGFIFQIIILCILIKIFVITIGRRRAGVFRSEGWVIITAIVIAVALNIVPEILRPPIELNPYVRDDYRLLIDSKGKMPDMYSYGHAFVRD